MNLPKPILGEITAFTINTPDLEVSLAFYKKLGYTELFRADWPFKWIQITDGVVLIMLRQDAAAYLALTYYVKDIAGVAAALEKKGLTFEYKPKKTDPVKRYLLRSPDGLPISLVNIIDGFKQPPGPGMLQMPQADYFDPSKYVNKVCGLFGELAQPVGDLEKSIAFWELLGFKAVSRFEAPYPWAILTDGLAIVGLHQTDKLSYPAITYFAADSRQKIAALKKAKVSGIKTDDPANAVITTPEQQHIFLYNLGSGASKEEPRGLVCETIETERLILRVLPAKLYGELLTSYPDDYIINYLGFTGPEELALQRGKWEQGMTTYRHSFVWFAVVERATGKVIGDIGLHNWYPEHKRSETGYVMRDALKKGQGFMKEAFREVVKYGFEKLGLNRIEAFTGPENAASQRLLKGRGFTQEGHLRQHFYKEGKMVDSLCFGLLREEWEKGMR